MIREKIGIVTPAKSILIHSDANTKEITGINIVNKEVGYFIPQPFELRLKLCNVFMLYLLVNHKMK